VIKPSENQLQRGTASGHPNRSHQISRRQEIALLRAADGATFSARVESIGGKARASYHVTLARGGDATVENGSRTCAGEREAAAWIDQAAHVRGFKSYPLSLRYPQHRVFRYRPWAIVGLCQRRTLGFESAMSSPGSDDWPAGGDRAAAG